MQQFSRTRLTLLLGMTVTLCAFLPTSHAQDAGATGVPGALGGGAMGGLGGALGGAMDRAATQMSTPPPPPPAAPAVHKPTKHAQKPHAKKSVHHRKHK